MEEIEITCCLECYFFVIFERGFDYDEMENIETSKFEGFCNLYEILYKKDCKTFAVKGIGLWKRCPLKKSEVIIKLKNFKEIFR